MKCISVKCKECGSEVMVDLTKVYYKDKKPIVDCPYCYGKIKLKTKEV